MRSGGGAPLCLNDAVNGTFSSFAQTLNLALLLRLALAILLGGAIGVERELKGKPAGLRTNILICIGAAVFTHLSILIGAPANEDRIAASIISGVGFIGAGAILHTRGSVTGLTSAATIWVVAAIGMAAGAGYWAGAVLATGVGVVSLRPLEWMKERLIPQRAAQRLVVELAENASAGPVLEAVERSGDLLALRREGKRLEIEIRIDWERRSHVLDEVASLDEVQEARWQ